MWLNVICAEQCVGLAQAHLAVSTETQIAAENSNERCYAGLQWLLSLRVVILLIAYIDILRVSCSQSGVEMCPTGAGVVLRGLEIRSWATQPPKRAFE